MPLIPKATEGVKKVLGPFTSDAKCEAVVRAVLDCVPELPSAEKGPQPSSPLPLKEIVSANWDPKRGGSLAAPDSGDLVERVAAALKAATHRNPLSDSYAHALARAAIEAMRDPSPAMKRAGETALQFVTLGARDIAHDTYTQMIDAALTEPSR